MFEQLKSQVLRYEDRIDDLQGENKVLKERLEQLAEVATEKDGTIGMMEEREKAVVSHSFTLIRVLVDLVKHFLQTHC